MKLFQRIKNLWNLSAYEPDYSLNPKIGETAILRETQIYKKPLSTVIPYKPRDPVKEIVGDETAI